MVTIGQAMSEIRPPIGGVKKEQEDLNDNGTTDRMAGGEINNREKLPSAFSSYFVQNRYIHCYDIIMILKQKEQEAQISLTKPDKRQQCM